MSSPYAFKPGGALKLKGDDKKYVASLMQKKEKVEHLGGGACGRRRVLQGQGHVAGEARLADACACACSDQSRAKIRRSASEACTYLSTHAAPRPSPQRGAQVAQRKGRLVQRVPRDAHRHQRSAQDRSWLTPISPFQSCRSTSTRYPYAAGVQVGKQSLIVWISHVAYLAVLVLRMLLQSGLVARRTQARGPSSGRSDDTLGRSRSWPPRWP